MIETALRVLLIADVGVAGLVADRVYPVILPSAPTYPAITYQVITNESQYSMQGPSRLARLRVQLDCYALTHEAVLALKGATIAALGGFRGAVGSPPVTIHGAFRIMEGDGFEATLSRSGMRVWRKTIDFTVWFKETF